MKQVRIYDEAVEWDERHPVYRRWSVNMWLTCEVCLRQVRGWTAWTWAMKVPCMLPHVPLCSPVMPGLPHLEPSFTLRGAFEPTLKVCVMCARTRAEARQLRRELFFYWDDDRVRVQAELLRRRELAKEGPGARTHALTISLPP